MTGDLQQRVDALDWYHTIELPGGVTTPGVFDHRGVLARYGLPPRLDGTRVLDVGSFDGFFAFELERRGAEVVALDAPDRASLDWAAPHLAEGQPSRFEPHHENFALAREALQSTVQKELLTVYEASPERLGTFDLVFVGSVLVHLRDPVRALMALRSVCRRDITIVEETDRRLDLFRSTPLARFQAPAYMTWWIANRAGWAKMLEAAGFHRVRIGATFVVPFRAARGGVRHTVLTATVT